MSGEFSIQKICATAADSVDTLLNKRNYMAQSKKPNCVFNSNVQLVPPNNIFGAQQLGNTSNQAATHIQ